jgi:hypothetical protein
MCDKLAADQHWGKIKWEVYFPQTSQLFIDKIYVRYTQYKKKYFLATCNEHIHGKGHAQEKCKNDNENTRLTKSLPTSSLEDWFAKYVSIQEK